MTEIEAFIILSSIPYLGSVKIRFLLTHFGSCVDALKASSSQIALMPGFDRVTPHWVSWMQNRDWEKDILLIEKQNIQVIPFTSPQYPKSLLELTDHPVLIYVSGEIKPQDKRSIAIVGTRNASIYGNEMAEVIGRQLAANGFTVVSGLARGIDTSAHQGALQGGRTLAVIGSGLGNIYPPENRKLGEEISRKGALISEFAMMTPPDRHNFPQRNRIVSGMTMGTLLIEAPIKSGAMITMQKALQQKRDLFALPGRADIESFRGNHLLIKNKQAHLIENAHDIIAHYQELFPIVQASLQAIRPHLDSHEQKILLHMPIEEIAIDTIASICSLPIQQVSGILMGLVLKKIIKEYPGKIYKKINMG